MNDEQYRGPSLPRLAWEIVDVMLDIAENRTERLWLGFKVGAAHCINQAFERFEERQDVFPED